MLAYTNTLKTKVEAVQLAQWHQDQDKFIQREFWDNKSQKGCSVGCMVHEYRATHGTSWHQATEPLYGIPQALSRLQDRIFEGLPIQDAKLWTVKFMTAIPEGKDLTLTVSKFLYWLLTDPNGVIKHASPAGKAAIIRVSELFDRRIKGDEPPISDWEAARKTARAAYAAADADADAAAYAAAAYAAAYAAYAAYAYGAADAAAYGAAADAAAYAAAAYADAAYADADADAYADADADADADAAAARQNYFKTMANKLLEILGE